MVLSSLWLFVLRSPGISGFGSPMDSTGVLKSDLPALLLFSSVGFSLRQRNAAPTLRCLAPSATSFFRLSVAQALLPVLFAFAREVKCSSPLQR